MGCRAYRSATSHSENRTDRHFRLWNSLSVGSVVWSHDHGYSRRGIFGGLVMCRTIGLPSDSYTLLVKKLEVSISAQTLPR